MSDGDRGFDAITLDAYRTLIDTRTVFAQTCEEIIRLEGLELDTLTLRGTWGRVLESLWSDPFETMYDRSARSLREAADELGVRVDAHRGIRLWWRRSANFGAFEDARRLIRTLDQQGIPHAIVSNGDDSLLRWHLSRSGLVIPVPRSPEGAGGPAGAHPTRGGQPGLGRGGGPAGGDDRRVDRPGRSGT
jgi:FMN phosphatase YigB (HAD superfamily)